MPLERAKRTNQTPLSPFGQSGRSSKGSSSRGPASLRSIRSDDRGLEPSPLRNPSYEPIQELIVEPVRPDRGEGIPPDLTLDVPEPPKPIAELKPLAPKARKKLKQEQKDFILLKNERWLVRNGHFVTFIGLYLFSVMVLYRPYELISGLGFLNGTAFYFAIATLAIFLPAQIATESTLTIFTREVKAILGMTLIAFVTIPIAKDPAMAWETFNEPFIKAVVIFIVLVNVVRTRGRLMSMIWLSFGISIYLGIVALQNYATGKFDIEEYRVAVDIGGIFSNPNDMALHFVTMTPLALALALGTRNMAMRLVYLSLTALFVATNMVTYSRGGFLGLVAAAVCLIWKVGRKYRAKVSIVSLVVGGLLIVAAPGNYGLRILSIFIPGLDSMGSSDSRRELLERSLLVTARNPWGIGIGCFPIVGSHDHQTHNAFTQVSSELGILGLVAYLVFIISPFRKLGAIERKLFDADDINWCYYVAIGLQASIIGYMVSSFFASVAYNWYIYYLIAYAVVFRRIYGLESGVRESGFVRLQAQPVPAT